MAYQELSKGVMFNFIYAVFIELEYTDYCLPSSIKICQIFWTTGKHPSFILRILFGIL
jgi:hypothetical protein